MGRFLREQTVVQKRRTS